MSKLLQFGQLLPLFLKLILDNPLQTRMVAKFPKGFSLSFFSLRRKKLGSLLESKAEILGGLILIGIGTKILLEHLGVL
jgi:hypothetical protein